MNLANSSNTIAYGVFDETVQKPSTIRLEILDFIASQLPFWRSQVETPAERAEPFLNSNLVSFLNHRSRKSPVDWVQFHPEKPDEEAHSRAIDISVQPCGIIVEIESQKYFHNSSLLSIECKRLPTPKGKDRDEREYVTSRLKTTGGIQRFKDKLHASKHRVAAMIGYIQKHDFSHWENQMASWIDDLSKERDSGWSETEKLASHPSNESEVTRFLSKHPREGITEICLHHLWICLNS